MAIIQLVVNMHLLLESIIVDEKTDSRLIDWVGVERPLLMVCRRILAVN